MIGQNVFNTAVFVPNKQVIPQSFMIPQSHVPPVKKAKSTPLQSPSAIPKKIISKNVVELKTPALNYPNGANLEAFLKELTIGKSNKSGSEILDQVKKLANEHKEASKINPTLLTTIHQLFEKAAEKLTSEGKTTEAFKARFLAAKKIKFNSSHPLYYLNDVIKKNVEKQANPSFGAHFSHLGTGVVKGGNIRASTRNVDGKMKDCFEFKLSSPYRKKLESNIAEIQAHKYEFITSLPKEFKGVSINYVPHFVKGKDTNGVFSNKVGFHPKDAYAWEIDFQGVGKVIVGNSPLIGNLYNNVSVELDASIPEEKKLKTMHQMMAVLGLGPVVCPNRQEDEQRMKIAQLFRSYYPKEAYNCEHQKNFFEIPVETLRKEIENFVPEMKSIFEKYLDKHPELMKEVEIYPGKSIWSIEDLGDQVKDQGVWGLMAGVGGGGPGFDMSINDASDIITSIMKQGALSGEDRFQSGLFKMGVSSESNYKAGSGDQVFVRQIKKSIADNNMIDQFSLKGVVQVLYDADVLNRGSYGYTTDKCGVKNEHDFYHNYPAVYQNRDNLINLAKKLGPFDTFNEVMIKNRIGPEYIRGLVVQKPENKVILLNKLRQAGIVKNVGGKEFIHGKPVDQFIHVANKFNENMWKK